MARTGLRALLLCVLVLAAAAPVHADTSSCTAAALPVGATVVASDSKVLVFTEPLPENQGGGETYLGCLQPNGAPVSLGTSDDVALPDSIQITSASAVGVWAGIESLNQTAIAYVPDFLEVDLLTGRRRTYFGLSEQAMTSAGDVAGVVDQIHLPGLNPPDAGGDLVLDRPDDTASILLDPAGTAVRVNVTAGSGARLVVGDRGRQFDVNPSAPALRTRRRHLSPCRVLTRAEVRHSGASGAGTRSGSACDWDNLTLDVRTGMNRSERAALLGTARVQHLAVVQSGGTTAFATDDTDTDILMAFAVRAGMLVEVQRDVTPTHRRLVTLEQLAVDALRTLT